MRTFVIESNWNKKPTGNGTYTWIKHGWGNGYVIIPPDHPAHPAINGEIDFPAHGGVTFGEYAENISWPQIEEVDGKSWVIGFDTGHYLDTLEKWPKERVIEETLRLAKFIDELTK